jgi:hypothetical protein
MKKIFLLMGCIALLASCGNKDKAAEPATTETTTEITETAAPAEAAPAEAAAPACEFAQADAQKVQSFGLRQDEAGAWILNFKAINAEGAQEGDLQKVELADGTKTIVIVDGAASTIEFAALEKSVLNNKVVNIWMKDGKIANIEEVQ